MLDLFPSYLRRFRCVVANTNNNREMHFSQKGTRYQLIDSIHVAACGTHTHTHKRKRRPKKIAKRWNEKKEFNFMEIPNSEEKKKFLFFLTFSLFIIERRNLYYFVKFCRE